MVYLTLVTALAIAGVAAWYSIVGLMAIFAGAIIPIAIMGGVLEVGKLVTAAWLHQNWKKTSLWMKSYLTSAVFVLMVITSLGIFGFLSKAHLEHSIAIGGTNELQIENLERQIARQQSVVADSEIVLSQLDAQVQLSSTMTAFVVLQARLQLAKVRQKKGKRSTRISMLRTSALRNSRRSLHRSNKRNSQSKSKLAL